MEQPDAPDYLNERVQTFMGLIDKSLMNAQVHDQRSHELPGSAAAEAAIKGAQLAHLESVYAYMLKGSNETEQAVKGFYVWAKACIESGFAAGAVPAGIYVTHEGSSEVTRTSLH